MIIDVTKKCRSYRRFDADRAITDDTLRELVNVARYTPSGANMQKLRFSLVTGKGARDTLFSTLKFAGYLKDWSGPSEGERPTAYIVISSESELNTLLAIDLGICAEAIALAAAELGIGCCMLRSFGADSVASVVGREGMIPHLVLALGYPAETVIVEDMKDGDVKYYRDEFDRHIVPKRTLDELII